MSYQTQPDPNVHSGVFLRRFPLLYTVLPCFCWGRSLNELYVLPENGYRREISVLWNLVNNVKAKVYNGKYCNTPKQFGWFLRSPVIAKTFQFKKGTPTSTVALLCLCVTTSCSKTFVTMVAYYCTRGMALLSNRTRVYMSTVSACFFLCIPVCGYIRTLIYLTHTSQTQVSPETFILKQADDAVASALTRRSFVKWDNIGTLRTAWAGLPCRLRKAFTRSSYTRRQLKHIRRLSSGISARRLNN